MRIVWIDDENIRPQAGHGIDFFIGGDPSVGRLIAVLRGFDWLHGQPERVEVHLRPVGGPGFDAIARREICAAIERLVRNKEVIDGQLSSGLYAHING